MQYVILDEARRKNCMDYIKSLPLKPLIGVAVKEFKLNRSNAQNNTFHWWCEIIGKETGHGQEYIKDTLKLKVLGTERRIINGVELTEIKSSSKLDVHEFSNLLAATEVLAHSLNITLPYPDEYKLARSQP